MKVKSWETQNSSSNEGNLWWPSLISYHVVSYYVPKKIHNKKVLRRERKRHTARRLASTRCAALSNPDLVRGGTRSQVWGGTPSQVLGGAHPRSGGYPVPGPGRTPSQVQGVPNPRSGGTPSRPGQGGTPGTPSPYLDLGWGTPLPGPGMGYPPYPDLRWGTPLQVWTDWKYNLPSSFGCGR